MSADQLVLQKTFTQEDFDRFAQVSGDNNPIHVDPAFSARTRFGRTVAHGLLINTVLHGMVRKLAPNARQVDQALMFPAPTYADEPMEFSVEKTGPDTLRFTVTRLADKTVTCTGHTTIAAGGSDAGR